MRVTDPLSSGLEKGKTIVVYNQFMEKYKVNKDKLLQMLEKACSFLLRMTIANARDSGHPVVFIPIHWAPVVTLDLRSQADIDRLLEFLLDNVAGD